MPVITGALGRLHVNYKHTNGIRLRLFLFIYLLLCCFFSPLARNLCPGNMFETTSPSWRMNRRSMSKPCGITTDHHSAHDRLQCKAPHVSLFKLLLCLVAYTVVKTISNGTRSVTVRLVNFSRKFKTLLFTLVVLKMSTCFKLFDVLKVEMICENFLCEIRTSQSFFWWSSYSTELVYK